jgi:hypothetical protein
MSRHSVPEKAVQSVLLTEIHRQQSVQPYAHWCGTTRSVRRVAAAQIAFHWERKVHDVVVQFPLEGSIERAAQLPLSSVTAIA